LVSRESVGLRLVQRPDPPIAGRERGDRSAIVLVHYDDELLVLSVVDADGVSAMSALRSASAALLELVVDVLSLEALVLDVLVSELAESLDASGGGGPW
jgi:hypothetical protein